MEKQLMERAANGTIDEVDFEMIKARLSVVISELRSHIDAINVLCDEHEDELKMMGINLVLSVDSTHKVVPMKALGLYGNRKFIKERMLSEISDHLEKRYD